MVHPRRNKWGIYWTRSASESTDADVHKNFQKYFNSISKILIWQVFSTHISRITYYFLACHDLERSSWLLVSLTSEIIWKLLGFTQITQINDWIYTQISLSQSSQLKRLQFYTLFIFLSLKCMQNTRKISIAWFR